ncbi:MAG TPA: hypothetical protein VFU22_10970 [Roseiflexaceae bacterium]|nr:hypothetical protein [Roseiflexaceae bacterium]
MRFKLFVALLVITFVLDIALLVFSQLRPAQPPAEPHVAFAAEPPTAQPTVTPSATNAPAPTALPTATRTPEPSPTPSPTASPLPSPTATISATTTPPPPARLLAAKSVSFTPSDRAVRANIRLALAHYYGALTHVVLPPAGVFSFNSTLGVRPQRLPWKNVRVKPTAAPALPEGAPPPADGATPTSEPAAQLIQGGGLCDLASRFVMAARPLLPARAFRFVNHVKSNGIHLSGVPVRDSVSIWAVGGGPGEQDLLITNLSEGWLEFTVDREGEKITVSAQLWDSPPPGW